jgi:UDP-glucose 4-epimerase
VADTLVLGGNGFLGSSLVDELASAGHRVTVFDRFSRGPVFTAGGVRVVKGDLSDADAVADAVSGQQVVFHFGGATTPASSLRDPLAEVQREVATTVTMLTAAAERGVERVVFASTGGAIYGDVGPDPASEQTAPAPISPYGIGKLAVEGFLRYFADATGLDTVALRISNPYGPRQRADREQGLIPILLRRIAAGEPVLVYGDGSMVRDYVFAPDVARQVARLADAPHAHAVYNVGSGRPHSIAEVLAVAESVMGRHASVERRDTPRGFVTRSLIDVTRFDTEFGRTATVELADGIDRTWRAIEREIGATR